MDATTRLPAPDKILARDRGFIAEWLIGTDDAGAETVVKLAVGHDKDRKALTAFVHQVIREHDRGFLVEKFAPFSDPSVRLPSKPVARYSKKAAEDFLNESLGAIYVTEDPTLHALFSGTVVEKF